MRTPLQLFRDWWGKDRYAEAVATGLTLGEKIAHYANRGGVRIKPLNLDEATEETQEMRALYRKMVREPSIKAAILSKLFSVASLDLAMDPVSDNPLDREVSDFIRHCLTTAIGGTRKLIESILYGGLIDGYSLCGPILRYQENGKYRGHWTLERLKCYDTNDYRFEVDAYRNITAVISSRDNVSHPVNQFVLWQHIPLYENPHGMSDLRAAVRQFKVIEHAWRLWSVCLERYTLPSLKGKYKEGADSVKETLRTALKEAKAQGYVIHPDSVEIEAWEMAVNAGPTFEAAVKQARHEVFLGITGAILQALEGNATGARSIGEVHQSTAELLVWYLAASVADTINDQIIPHLVQINYGSSVEYPRVKFGGVNDGDLTASLAIDTGLMQAGVPLSLEELYARYNRQPPKDDADKATALPGGGAPSPFRGGFSGANPTG